MTDSDYEIYKWVGVILLIGAIVCAGMAFFVQFLMPVIQSTLGHG